MNKLTIFLLLISTPILLFPQVKPESYKLLNKNKLGKAFSSGNPISNSIGNIIVVGNTVWLGTGSGVSFSTDNGETWNNKSFGEESIATIGYDKYHNTFWASTVHSENVQNIGDVYVGSGLHYTTDNGNTWISIPQPVDNPGDSSIVYGINDGVHLPKVRALPITVEEQNVVWQLGFTPNAVWIATWAGGIRRSSDMGQTWQRVVLPSDSLNSISPTDTIDYALSPQSGKFGTGWNNFLGFSVSVVNDSTVYVGTANGINKTTNAEDQNPSWIKFNHLNQESSISGNWVWKLDYNKADNSIWAATWKADGPTEIFGVSFSTDGGQNWHIGLPNEERVNNFGFKADQPIAASDDGLFRSSDMGLTWITPGSIVDQKTDATITTHAFSSVAVSGDTIWVGSAQGLARLIETGTSMWQGSWKVYNSAQETKEIYAFPNPFNPKLDERITFKYDTGNRNANVTIRIFNFGMKYIKTVIQNAPRKLASSDSPIDSWDGTNDNGRVVPNGVYFYRIDIGNDNPLFGKIIVLQ